MGADVNLLGPQIVLLGSGLLLLVADLLPGRKPALSAVGVAAILASVIYSAALFTSGSIGDSGFGGALVFDRFAAFFQFLLAGSAIAAVLLSRETLAGCPRAGANISP